MVTWITMTRERTQLLKYLFLLLCVTIPLFSLGLSNHGLWSADEPRVAEIGREMALTGNWAVPMLNRRPFLEQPPLYYAVLALTFRTFGVSDKVARIPSALFAFGTVLVLFVLAYSLFGARVAFLSGFILSTGGEYFRVAHFVLVDSALTFFVMSAVALFITGYLAQDGRRKLFCYVLMYGAATLAFYAKGFIGVIIPGAGILAFLAVDRNMREISRMRPGVGLLIFLVMTLPWFMALWNEAGWEHLRTFFLHNHLQRFFPAGMAGQISDAASGHHHPFYYYLTEFPNGFLPWSILLIPVLSYAFSKKAQRYEEGTSQDKGRLFALCWFLAGISFLTVASTKRTLYLMPIFAPISLLTARYIDYTLTSRSVDRIGKAFVWAFDLLLLAIGLGLIPAYFWAKGMYLEAVPDDLLKPMLVLSVLVSLMALLGAIYLKRRRMAYYWTVTSLTIMLMLVITLVGGAPMLDRYKSFVPFCNQVTALVAADKPLFAYKPDETLRGALPFYTGRFLIEVDEIGDISSADGVCHVTIRDRKGRLENELLSTGSFYLLHKRAMGSDLAIFSSRPDHAWRPEERQYHDRFTRKGDGINQSSVAIPWLRFGWQN